MTSALTTYLDPDPLWHQRITEATTVGELVTVWRQATRAGEWTDDHTTAAAGRKTVLLRHGGGAPPKVPVQQVAELDVERALGAVKHALFHMIDALVSVSSEGMDREAYIEVLGTIAADGTPNDRLVAAFTQAARWCTATFAELGITQSAGGGA